MDYKISKIRSIPQIEISEDYFVGRDDIINSYWNDYLSHTNESKDWTLSVINYYGM